MRERFHKEGLDFEILKPEDRILQVWRWLVDAESNLHNSRRMLDKLYEQQHEEIEEMENYLGKIRKLAEKRTDDLESEKVCLYQEREKLDCLLQSANVMGSSLCDKVYKLLEERNQAEKNFETLKALQLSANGNIDADTDILAEMIKVSFEKECLKREVAELSDRVVPLEKSCRQLEIDNERLSFKLSEALAEIEERETQLGLSERQNVWFTEMKNRHSEISKCTREGHETESLDISPKETLSCSFPKEPSHSIGADSTPPSLLLSELASFGSPKKLSSLLETCNELAWAEEVKKLQCESENLRSQLTVLGEKYNALVLKHIQYKTKRKFQIEEVRERLQACECQVETLQTQLSIQRQRLRAEELFRKQIEADYRRLQEERRSISSRLLNAETHQREEGRELAILQRKVVLLDNANSELVAQLMKLKYKSNLTKSTTCDDMLSSL
ncbi:tropomyosin isoform X2 [Halyomorpha halys]|nr:putative leucine-rich repeat-containing protein DDB_G0290503 isoform X2 [Halyomorpha halys]